MTPDELQATWKAVCAEKKQVKFGGGFYCCKIGDLFVRGPAHI